MWTWIGGIILAIVILLSVLLIMGFPLGELTMGGRYKIWPMKLRGIALLQMLLQIFALMILLQGGRMIPLWFSNQTVKIICFVFSVFFISNTIMNAVSKSKKEKMIMTPMSFMLVICFGITGFFM